MFLHFKLNYRTYVESFPPTQVNMNDRVYRYIILVIIYIQIKVKKTTVHFKSNVILRSQNSISTNLWEIFGVGWERMEGYVQ